MFLIISTISIGQSPLDYHPVRNVFSAEHRLEQTMETIDSIRKHTKEKILFVECGNHHKSGFSVESIRGVVDQFIDLGTDEEVNAAVNSPHKSWAELVSIRSALKFVEPSEEYIFKLSGRYSLTSRFNLNSFKSGQVSAKVFREHGPIRCCSVLYSVQGTSNYSNMCDHCCNKFHAHKRTSMEEMLFDWAKNKHFNIVESIGCKGKIAVNGNDWEE